MVNVLSSRPQSLVKRASNPIAATDNNYVTLRTRDFLFFISYHYLCLDVLSPQKGLSANCEQKHISLALFYMYRSCLRFCFLRAFYV